MIKIPPLQFYNPGLQTQKYILIHQLMIQDEWAVALIVLRLFADGNVNLLKIESRPRRKGRWEYIFLMDFEGDARNDAKIQDILEEMSKSVIWSKLLGTYPINSKQEQIS